VAVAARLVVGILVVVLGATFIARFADRPQPVSGPGTTPVKMPVTDEAATARPAVTLTARGAAWRFLRALVRLTVLLVPEYLVVVLLVGGLRGGSSSSVVASSVPGCCWCSSLRWSARSW